MERFQLKPTIFFGPDALAALEGLAGRRVMVITDSFLAQSGLLERVRARLRDCTVEVFDQVVPDPPLELVAQGARALAEFRPQAVVAFGGGSPMDCAKAMLEFGKKLGTGADIRFVAVPTTAGTGSEVTSFAVLTDRAKGVKYPLVDDALLPDEAILDPSLLAGVPPAVTADTGMDVLTHAAEAYVARGATPYTDALAEKAFTLAWQNLRPAWETAGESGAKGNMLLASNLAEVLAIFFATLIGFTILEPVHLLWINLITDCFPALALGLEQSEPDIMKRAPRDPKEGIFAGGMGFDVFFQGAIVTVLVMVSYLLGHYIESGVWEFVNSPDGTTMAFLTLSMVEIFHSLNMRSRRGSLFKMTTHNHFLFGAMVVSLILTTAVIEVPFLAAAFEFTPIDLNEYAVALGLAVLIIPIMEIVKFFQRKLGK